MYIIIVKLTILLVPVVGILFGPCASFCPALCWHLSVATFQVLSVDVAVIPSSGQWRSGCGSSDVNYIYIYIHVFTVARNETCMYVYINQHCSDVK